MGNSAWFYFVGWYIKWDELGMWSFWITKILFVVILLTCQVYALVWPSECVVCYTRVVAKIAFLNFFQVKDPVVLLLFCSHMSGVIKGPSILVPHYMSFGFGVDNANEFSVISLTRVHGFSFNVDFGSICTNLI